MKKYNKTRSQKNKNSKTRRHKKVRFSEVSKSTIVKSFIEILNTIKLYHWKTHSFSQHKATDELYSSLNEHIDAFVEILMGKDESRIKIINKKIQLIDLHDSSDLKKYIYRFRNFLIDMDHYLDAKHDTDLLNIRDEILGDINKFLYLLTLSK